MSDFDCPDCGGAGYIVSDDDDDGLIVLVLECQECGCTFQVLYDQED